jgi:23S rRNA pseudouridine955/2504/2580 synthase
MCKQSSSDTVSFSVQMLEIDSSSAGQRLDNFLIRQCKGVPKSHLYRAVRSGQVRVNRGRVKVDYRLQLGDLVRVPPMRVAQGEVKPLAPKAEFPIVFEDDDILVVNKPSGVAVHGGSGVSYGVIEQLRSARPQQRFLELAHRLDRETSGLLILAKRRPALVALHDMFRQDRAHKHYKALVTGDISQKVQHIKKPLLRYLTAEGERRVRVDPQGRYAHTIVTCLQRYQAYTLVDAEIITGRTHQIRVHLNSIGHAIVGDDKYGDDELRKKLSRQGFKRMFLHAYRLRFPHPVSGEWITVEADLPPDCEELLRRIEANNL